MYGKSPVDMPVGHELEMSHHTQQEVGTHLAHHIMSQPPLREQFSTHRLYLPVLGASPYYHNCLLTQGQWEAVANGPTSHPSRHPPAAAISALADWWVGVVSGWLCKNSSETPYWLSVGQGTTTLPATREVAVFLELSSTRAFDWGASSGVVVKPEYLPALLTTLPLYMREWLRRGLEQSGWRPVSVNQPDTYQAEGQPVIRLYLLLCLLHAAVTSPNGIPYLGKMATAGCQDKRGGMGQLLTDELGYLMDRVYASLAHVRSSRGHLLEELKSNLSELRPLPPYHAVLHVGGELPFGPFTDTQHAPATPVFPPSFKSPHI